MIHRIKDLKLEMKPNIVCLVETNLMNPELTGSETDFGASGNGRLFQLMSYHVVSKFFWSRDIGKVISVTMSKLSLHLGLADNGSKEWILSVIYNS